MLSVKYAMVEGKLSMNVSTSPCNMSRAVARGFIILSYKARNSSSESRNLQLQENNVLQCCNLFSKSCAKFQINYCKRIPSGTFELIIMH